MDTRNRASTAVPRVRQVGFVTPNDAPHPNRTQSGPPDSNSPASNSLSPVMIPPPRHLSDNLSHPLHISDRSAAVVGSYNPSESLLVISPPGASSPSSRLTDGDFSDPAWPGTAKFASSLPTPGFPKTLLNTEKVEGKTDKTAPDSIPLKAKTTKAERRALQESQRAAKAAKEGKSGAGNEGGGTSKAAKQPAAHKKEVSPAPAASVVGSERKGGDRVVVEKERRKDAPPPRMQFDDKSRVEKAKRRAVVNQKEARNRVELFRHLPQYERGSQLPDLESKFFQLDPMHPAVYKVGLQYLAGDICGGNARCIAMLEAFKEVVKDYTTPPEKSLTRDLTVKIGAYVSFLIECRPLSMSMGNAIRFLKSRIAKMPLNLPESEAKLSLCTDIDRFIAEKIILADNVIVRHAATKVRDGDVLLTYGSSCVVEMVLLHAHELGKQFRVVIVDSRPKLEGQALLRRLIAKGLRCTYTHINAVSYVMHEVTRVFLGASSVLSNGTVYSRVGTACVAMVAHEFRVPVLICCEAYKFHERVQLDSICSNELGDPDAIAKVPGRRDINYLDNLSNKENLQLLNLMYDATPSEYISMIITDYGMIPPTSVPVIVREYRREHLWI